MTHLALFIALYLVLALLAAILFGRFVAFGDRDLIAEITASREDNTEGDKE